MATLASVIQYGTAADMPTAAIPGRLYFTSDTEQQFYDTGSAWENVTPLLNAASITAIQQEKYVYAVDSGTVNVLAVSLTSAPTIVAGSLVVVKVANTNTGAATIAVNGAAAVAITKEGSTALSGGEMHSGQIVFLIYDGTEYQLIGGIGSGNGSVTSIGLAVPARQSVSGSPVTSSGTITITDNAQSANEVFAGPASGSAAAPGFRAIVSADLPVATTSALGAVKPDGTTITVNGSGVISASGGGGGGTSVQFGAANPNGVNTPVLVQSANAASSASVTTTNAVTSGNLLVVAGMANNGLSSATVSDTLGTSYTQLKYVSGSAAIYLWAGIAHASGVNTVTMSGYGSDTHPITSVMEFSGCTTTLDGAVQSVASSGSPTTSLTVTTTLPNDLLIAAYADGTGNNSGSMNSGWTSIFFNGDNDWWDLAVAYQVASSVGNYSGQWTLTHSSANNTAIAALKAKSTPVSGSEGDLYFQTSATPYTGFVYHDSAWNQIQ